MIAAAQHIGNMTLVAEDISRADNRVTLSDTKDAFGVPVLQPTHHDLGDDLSRAAGHSALKRGKRFSKPVARPRLGMDLRVAMHIMGGTIMGKDEHQSVTDDQGRVHDTDNLYVAGPSLFLKRRRESTFTLSALAERQAEHLIKSGYSPRG